MPAEIPLTKDQITLAERRVGFLNHPVIAVIDRHLPQIAPLMEVYASVTNNQEQQRFIAQNYGFLADAFVEATPYTLQPLELVAIWSKAGEVFPGYHRYALAGMIAGAYGIQGAENPGWKRFPRHYLETSKLPAEVVTDKSGVRYVMRRLDHIRENLDDLDFYVYGTREDPMGYAAQLGKRIVSGDQGAQAELDRLIAYQNEHKTPVLSQLHENFGNGFAPLYFPLRDALGLD